MRRGISLFVILISQVMVACTPTYTAQTADQFSRSIGTSNQYQIQRWHNRAIPVSSRLAVSIAPSEVRESLDIADTVSGVFAEAFASVHRLGEPVARETARRQARSMAANFLLYIQAVKITHASLGSGDQQPDPAAQRAQSNSEGGDGSQPPDNADRPAVARIQLRIALIDVVSGNTVDICLVTANTAHYNVLGSDVRSLLHKPLTQLANDLTGCLNDRCA